MQAMRVACEILDTSGMHADLGRLMPLKEDSGNPLHKKKFSEYCAIALERTQRFAELLDALPALLVAWYFPNRALVGAEGFRTTLVSEAIRSLEL